MSLPSSAFTMNSGARVPTFRISAIVSLRSVFEQSSQNFVDGLGIGAAFSFLHYLPDEKLEDAFVARAVLRDIVGVLRDYFAANFLDGTSIADWREALRRDNLARGFAGFEHSGEDAFADRSGNFAFFNSLQQVRESFWVDRRIRDFFIRFVQPAEQFCLNPICGGLGRSSGTDNLLKIIRECCAAS